MLYFQNRSPGVGGPSSACPQGNIEALAPFVSLFWSELLGPP